MKFRKIASVLTTLAVLTGSLVGTEVTKRNIFMDLISGITRKSKDVITYTVEQAREIFPPGKVICADDYVIYEIFEYLKDKFKYPHPSLGVPVLDPYQSNFLDLNITNDIIGQLSISLRDINVTKASQFKINNMKMKWLIRKLKFDVHFPEILFRAKYDMKGVLGNTLPFHGNGSATISAINLNFTGTVDLGRRDTSLHMKKIVLNYSIDTFQVNMSNLMGGGRLGEHLNKALSQEGTQILELVRTDVTQFGTSWFQTVGNRVLAKMGVTLSGVLDFMKTVGTKKIRKIFNFQPLKSEL